MLPGSTKMVKSLSNPRLSRLFLLLFLFVRWCPAQDFQGPIMWHPWSPEIFAQAAREHKLVLLNLGTGWCHWGRVMDQGTYSGPDVNHLLRKQHIASKLVK